MSATSFTLRGWHVLAMLLAFFGSVIAVNAAFITFAWNSFPGEDVPHSYTQGLEYNQTLAERRGQALIGWQANADLAAIENGARVEVLLRARDGAPIDAAEVTGELEWPAAARHDRALTFRSVGAGRYAADVRNLPPGRWRLRAHAQDALGELDFQSDLTWPSH
jgi:nitrogen fixation protein FixH